jgi:hypothetical protein
MSEELERLRATVRELEAELKSLHQVDPQTKSLLEEVRAEIEAKLHGPAVGAPSRELLSSRLSEAAERMETTHPNLFGMVARLADALAQLGI